MKSGESFLSFLLEKSCTIDKLLRHKLHCHINYTILICICIFSLPREGAIILVKCFLLHLHVKFLFPFDYAQSDSTAKLNLLCLVVIDAYLLSIDCMSINF